VTIIDLCSRCGGEGHLMGEGRAVNVELAEIDAELLAECARPETGDETGA
jgi:hypothetical protein